MVNVTPDIQRLADALSSSVRNSALLLGFDATAALLGHVDHGSLNDELGDGGRLEIRRLIAREVAAHSTPTGRGRLLKRITQPRHEEAIDYAAIQVIADVVEAAGIRAIVATDPGQCLYIALRQCGLDLPRVQIDGFDSRILKSILSDRTTSCLFVDAGGILLHGFRDGVGQHPQWQRSDLDTPQYVQSVQAELKKFVGDFQDAYLWGWCPANVPLPWVCADGDTPTIHKIGAHTQHGDPDRNPVLDYNDLAVEDPARAWADTTWWSALAEVLRIERTNPMARSRPAAVAGGLRHRPPVTDDVLANLVVVGANYPLCVIGHASESVRSGIAHWLSGQDFGDDLDCVSYAGTDLADLGRRVIMQIARPVGRRVVACLTGPAGPVADWSAGFTMVVQQWLARDDPQKEGEEGEEGWRSVLLLCPPEMSRWAAEDQWEGTVWCETHVDTDPGLNAVRDWLRRTTSDLGLSPATEDLDMLAKRMADAEADGAMAGLLAETLDFWAVAVSDRLAADRTGRELPVQDLTELWDTVVDRHRRVAHTLRDASTFQVTVLESSPDFDLGPIIPLPPRAGGPGAAGGLAEDATEGPGERTTDGSGKEETDEPDA